MAPPAMAPGTARARARFTFGVRRGRPSFSLTPRRLTPHHNRPAWITPETVTAALVASKTMAGENGNKKPPSSGARVQRFRKTGPAADRANRPPVFSTPDSREAMVMQAR